MWTIFLFSCNTRLQNKKQDLYVNIKSKVHMSHVIYIFLNNIKSCKPIFHIKEDFMFHDQSYTFFLGFIWFYLLFITHCVVSYELMFLLKLYRVYFTLNKFFTLKIHEKENFKLVCIFFICIILINLYKQQITAFATS